jgi:microcin C transport system substrate-binding protein
MALSRRALMLRGAALVAAPALQGLPAVAQDKAWTHALSLFGEVKYPADFKQFGYVNPSAPKGGTVRLGAFGTFDNFNYVVVGVKGSLAGGIGLTLERLMTNAEDEVATTYGLLAEVVSHPPDFSSVTYRLRPQARWHDGKPVTIDDVIFSFQVFKENNPQLGAYYRHVVKAEKTGEREVTFTFDQPGNRELPQIVGELFVLPKHWWEANDASGKKRNATQTTLEPPLGSGPYRIKDFAPGRAITYERVKDHWGKDLPVNLGSNNFNEVRFEYFRDSTVALEGFKADQFDFRAENSAKNWATAYDFPAVQDKRVVKEEFPIRDSGIMQAFTFNLRRSKFSDARLRRAFNFLFDFEDMNQRIFYGQYTRISSYFERTELASRGLPQGHELEILNTVKDQVPPEVFTTPYTNPVGGGREALRKNLREALRLLRAAGYEIKNTKLVETKSGEHLNVELLIFDSTFERVMLPYKSSLEHAGIAASVRVVDPQQYQNRLRQFDFDIVVNSWPESLSPGNEQRGFWGSRAADQPGSRNVGGIKNEAIDKLIEHVIFTKDRDDLIAATRALDRVLLWNHYVVPQWTTDKERTARWDRFGRPDTMPKYGREAFPTIWWWDEARAAKVQQRS